MGKVGFVNGFEIACEVTSNSGRYRSFGSIPFVRLQPMYDAVLFHSVGWGRTSSDAEAGVDDA